MSRRYRFPKWFNEVPEVQTRNLERFATYGITTPRPRRKKHHHAPQHDQ